jgi:hypothetical protein
VPNRSVSAVVLESQRIRELVPLLCRKRLERDSRNTKHLQVLEAGTMSRICGRGGERESELLTMQLDSVTSWMIAVTVQQRFTPVAGVASDDEVVHKRVAPGTYGMNWIIGNWDISRETRARWRGRDICQAGSNGQGAREEAEEGGHARRWLKDSMGRDGTSYLYVSKISEL